MIPSSSPHCLINISSLCPYHLIIVSSLSHHFPHCLLIFSSLCHHSKNYPTYPERNIPQTPNQQFMFRNSFHLGLWGFMGYAPQTRPIAVDLLLLQQARLSMQKRLSLKNPRFCRRSVGFFEAKKLERNHIFFEPIPIHNMFLNVSHISKASRHLLQSFVKVF